MATCRKYLPFYTAHLLLFQPSRNSFNFMSQSLILFSCSLQDKIKTRFETVRSLSKTLQQIWTHLMLDVFILFHVCSITFLNNNPPSVLLFYSPLQSVPSPASSPQFSCSLLSPEHWTWKSGLLPLLRWTEMSDDKTYSHTHTPFLNLVHGQLWGSLHGKDQWVKRNKTAQEHWYIFKSQSWFLTWSEICACSFWISAFSDMFSLCKACPRKDRRW